MTPRRSARDAPTPTIVFLALYLGTRELLDSLLSMPDYVLPVVEPRFIERTGFRGECLVDDFGDVPRLLARIEDWSRGTARPITGVLGIDDEDQFDLSRAVARHFGVAFPDDATLSVASNKYLQKRQFVRHAVPTGEFVLLDAASPDAGADLGFPNVLKTLTGSGSEYVFKNRDQGELTENLRYLCGVLGAAEGDPRYRVVSAHLPGEKPRFDTRREFLLEEYLEGDEFSCDFLLHDGTVRLLRVVKKLAGRYLGNFDGFYLLNEHTASEEGIDLPELRSVCRRVAAALGVASGVQMMDFIKGRDGLRVLETSIRPGFSIFLSLMRAVYDYTSLGLAARLKAGESVDVTIPEEEGLALYLLADRPGMVAALDVSPLNAMRDELGILDVGLYAKPGDVIVDARHDHFDLILGYVLIRNPERSRIQEIVQRVREACVIETTVTPG
jgi:hypothetical protein